VNKNHKIFFRTDGNSEIGLGHFTRSLALASMLQPYFNCCFLLKTTPEQIILQVEGIAEIKKLQPDLPTENEPEALLNGFLPPESILVLDGYQFDTAYQNRLKEAGLILVCIDDIHAFHFVADAIINVAGSVKESDYSAESYTRFLFGPSYCLLREPFLKAALLPASDKNYAKLFLNLGGADIENDSQKILEQLAGFSVALEEINVVIGPAYPHLSLLRSYIQNMPSVKIHQNLSAQGMCSLMMQCGVAICPPSGVSYEYCTVRGLLFLFQTADNQAGIKEFLIQNSLALPFQDFELTLSKDELKKEKAQRLIRNQETVFDGRSPERFRDFFQSLC
jgi:UDP-2,4-diacetamido-2,4,6-trideoxy-beta-L-altropyranose hydrolase